MKKHKPETSEAGTQVDNAALLEIELKQMKEEATKNWQQYLTVEWQGKFQDMQRIYLS